MNQNPSARIDFTGAELGQAVIHHIGHVINTQAAPGLSAHSHRDCFEICYLRRGRMHWWSEHPQSSYVLQAGAFSLTAPSLLHGGVDNIHEAGDLYWLSVNIDQLRADTDLDEALCVLIEKRLLAAPRSFIGDEKVCVYFDIILSALEHPGPMMSMRIRSALYQILLQVCDVLQNLDDAAPPMDVRIQKVLDIIAVDIVALNSVEEMAAVVGLSPNRFIHSFRQATGYSPIDFLCREKIRLAKDMLGQAERSVTDITFSLNFSTTQYFATVFKKYTGMTPTQYRRENFL